MEFNKNWTKDDNDIMRKMISEHKTVDEIREFFGNDKLFYHPTKKYYRGSGTGCLPNFSHIKNYKSFLNEINYTSLETEYDLDIKKSLVFKNQFDFKYTFKTKSNNEYVIDFIYLIDTIGLFKNRDIYNVSFTLKNQRNMSNYDEYEKETKLNEQHELMRRLIYIFKDFNDKYGKKCIYLIGETIEIKKIKWYRNLINDSFKQVIETKDISSFTNGLPAYYFEVVEL